MASYAFFFNQKTFEQKQAEINSGDRPIIDYVGMEELKRPFVNFSPKDELFVVGLRADRIWLAGRMIVGFAPMTRERAAQQFNRSDFIDKKYICLAEQGEYDVFRTKLSVPKDVARGLILYKTDGEQTDTSSLKIDKPDQNLFRACPRLAEESATAFRNLLGFREEDSNVESGAGDFAYDTSAPIDEDYLLRSIKSRRGQPEFRRKLLSAYKGRCVITNCGVEELLEAAHIKPHSKGVDYGVSNGFLFRADIHTLFDLNLLAVDEFNNVKLSESLRNTEYWVYNGKKLLRVPDRSGDMPNRDALCARLALLRN